MVEKVALGHVSLSECFGVFFLSASFHHCSVLVFIYMLPLADGQTGKAWEPLSAVGEHLMEMYLPHFFVFKGLSCSSYMQKISKRLP
jgi:hypothetical protein